jgi:hypothetical protein
MGRTHPSCPTHYSCSSHPPQTSSIHRRQDLWCHDEAQGLFDPQTWCQGKLSLSISLHHMNKSLMHLLQAAGTRRMHGTDGRGSHRVY